MATLDDEIDFICLFFFSLPRWGEPIFMTSLIVKRLGELNSNSLFLSSELLRLLFFMYNFLSTLCRDEKENNMTSRENVHHSGPAKSPRECVCVSGSRLFFICTRPDRWTRENKFFFFFFSFCNMRPPSFGCRFIPGPSIRRAAFTSQRRNRKILFEIFCFVLRDGTFPSRPRQQENDKCFKRR